MAKETRWLYTASCDLDALREESKGVCVIPMGCIEKHGLHLPLGTDILQASRIAYEASQLETVTVFADYTFGDVPLASPSSPPGTITLDVSIQMELLEELCEQIARWGYKKIFIFNGHGGNVPWLGTFLRNIALKKRSYIVGSTLISLPALHQMGQELVEHGSGYIPELTKEDEELLIKNYQEKITGGHACMGETAHMMGICPEAVHFDRLGIESGLSTHVTDHISSQKIDMTLVWDFNYPNTFAGHDPVGCNERIGKASIRMASERLAEKLKIFKEDEVMPKLLLEDYQKGW